MGVSLSPLDARMGLCWSTRKRRPAMRTSRSQQPTLRHLETIARKCGCEGGVSKRRHEKSAGAEACRPPCTCALLTKMP
eukprot:7847530-Pyramimonas_sp.AAC.1